MLILEHDRLLGLLTDSDLRNRVLAAGRSVDEPISEVMTRDPITLGRQQSAFEAALLMGRKGIQHLPVVESGKVVGMLTARQLLQSENRHELFLMARIKQADSVAELARLCRDLPSLQQQLMAAGAEARHLGQLLAQVSDTLTRRLLHLAEVQLGPAPVSYTWVACGSQARGEQTLSSDQDHALILADDYDPQQHDDYFQQLSRHVSDGLQQCGFKYCPGESMALNRNWRKRLRHWQDTFAEWLAEPEPQSLRYAVNFFDMRAVHGQTELVSRLQTWLLPRVKDNQIFLNRMAALAAETRPPLGFFRNFVLIHSGEHAHQLDLKLGGLVPVADLARVYALAAASEAQNTRDRLKVAVANGLMSQQQCEGLLQAYELIATLRARHQAEQIVQGESLDNYLQPDELNTLQRSHLKDAFRLVKEAQEAMSRQFQDGF